MDYNCIKCSICLDVIIQACTLRCGHSFCELCLDDAVNYDDRCPECRQLTQGICINNLRLNDCIQDFLKKIDGALENYTQVKAQRKVRLLLRRQSRGILFSLLLDAEKPLTIEEMEHEWKVRANRGPFSSDLKRDMVHVIQTNPHYFDMTCYDGNLRVSLRRTKGQQSDFDATRSTLD